MSKPRRVRFPWDDLQYTDIDVPTHHKIFKLNKGDKKWRPEVARLEDTQDIIDRAGYGFTIYEILERASRGEVGLIKKYHLENMGNTTSAPEFQGLDLTQLPDGVNILDAIKMQKESENALRRQVSAVSAQGQGVFSPPVQNDHKVSSDNIDNRANSVGNPADTARPDGQK